MRAPSSLAFLLAVSVANALVIPVPALNSLNLDLAAPVNNVIDAVPVVIGEIKAHPKQEERSTALEARTKNRLYGFRFQDVGRQVFGGVQVLWTFSKRGHVVNMIQCVNDTDNTVLVRLMDSVKNTVLEVMSMGPRGTARITSPHLVQAMDLEIQSM